MLPMMPLCQYYKPQQVTVITDTILVNCDGFDIIKIIHGIDNDFTAFDGGQL